MDKRITKTFPDRFYLLDILRGIAALSVVLWHWQHFFLQGTLDIVGNEQLDKSHYPLYIVLRPFYGQGWRAVELFFTLSGFIFFWLYNDKIAGKKISFQKYIKLRISRLYPLHILTLFMVIVGQYLFYKIHHTYFVFTNFNLKVFFENLTLTHNWFSSVFSFNGPSWSISVEMLLYIVFFSFSYFLLGKWWCALALILLGMWLRGSALDSTGIGLISFFAGGFTYFIFKWQIINWQKRKRLLFAFSVAPLFIFASIILRYVIKIELPPYAYELCLFPLIILMLAIFEVTIDYGIFIKRLSFLGDISYSSYLLHFPLQLVFMLIVPLLGKSIAIFYSVKTLGLFYLILIGISFMSYHYFEKPVQNLIRKKWIKEGAKN